MDFEYWDNERHGTILSLCWKALKIMTADVMAAKYLFRYSIFENALGFHVVYAYFCQTINFVRGVTWNAPKSMWKMILSCDRIRLKFWNAPKFHFRFLFSFQIDHVLKFWNAPFFLFYSENIFHMLFGAFQVTPRISIGSNAISRIFFKTYPFNFF